MICFTMKAKRLLHVLIVILSGFTATGKGVKNVPYYINLNTSTGTKVYEINDESLNLQYHDSYGRWNEIPFQIADVDGNVIATVTLTKVFGLNSFVIPLKDIYSGWKSDETYFSKMIDEHGKVYELLFRIVEAPAKPDPIVNILVSPEEMDCDGLSFSLVKFYGDIQGGKAPYVVSWYVLNNERTDFLFQPREQVIEQAGKTPVITVDKNPDYYVVLYVKDACGKIKQSVVQLVCDNSRKKINTVFVEQITVPYVAPGH